jgi:hypothetical protein
MRQKRYPLLLDTTYPPERQVLGAINAVPDGERAGFLRALILLGNQEIEKERKRAATAEKMSEDARGDHGAGTH